MAPAADLRTDTQAGPEVVVSCPLAHVGGSRLNVAYGTTSTTAIIPKSSCERMWQW